MGSGRSELILERKEVGKEPKSQTIVGCKHRVGNSFGSLSRTSEVGLAKRKENIGKKTATRQESAHLLPSML